MYQIGITRFIFMTLFRSFSFALSAIAVYFLKQYMEKKQYEREERMVFVKGSNGSGTSGRSNSIKRQVNNKKPSTYCDPW